MSKPSIIFILGMHRSGTSVLTHVVQELGVSLGTELIAPSFDNPEGFFEHARLVAFNNQIFETLGLHWDATIPMPTDWQNKPEIKIIQQQIITWLQQEFDMQKIIALKDPRLCRTLPIWLEAADQAGFTPNAIHIFRDVAEVASSFAVRENTDHRKAVILSMLYLAEAERATRSIPRVMITYDQLFADIKTVLNSIYQLPIEWLYSPEVALMRTATIVKPKLRHQQKPDLTPFLDSRLLQISKQVNDSLQHPENLSADILDKAYQEILVQIAHAQQWFGFWHTEAMHSHSLAVDLHHRNLELRERQSMLDNYMLHAKQLEGHASNLEQRIANLEQENVTLTQTLANTQSQLNLILNSRGWKMLEKLRIFKTKWLG